MSTERDRGGLSLIVRVPCFPDPDAHRAPHIAFRLDRPVTSGTGRRIPSADG